MRVQPKRNRTLLQIRGTATRSIHSKSSDHPHRRSHSHLDPTKPSSKLTPHSNQKALHLTSPIPPPPLAVLSLPLKTTKCVKQSPTNPPTAPRNANGYTSPTPATPAPASPPTRTTSTLRPGVRWAAPSTTPPRSGRVRTAISAADMTGTRCAWWRGGGAAVWGGL